ncbi:MAG: response regulator [Lachnospiraceae bacterium]|nr:response regulator [Lachnospiraceae bacterium]
MSKTTTILCIDDDKAIRFALSRLFSLQGWQCLEAADSDSGVRLFEQEQPDMVLVDYHMPGENGVETVRRLRRLSQSTPVIVFTIESSQQTADAFLEAGATDFATKPIKAPDIISRIRLHLRMLEQQRELQREEPSAFRPEKGMSEATMTLVMEYMRTAGNARTVEEIAEGTGLANPTTYRYLQHLVREKRLIQQVDYGKVGRPKQRYRIP